MTLREELSAIAGVVEADIDLRDGRPTAIRIHVDQSSDQRVIGEAVRAALRRHGLRSRMAPPRTDLEPAQAPAPPHLTLTPRVGAPRPAQGMPHVTEERRQRRIGEVAVADDGGRTTITVSDDAGSTKTAEARRAPAAQIAAVVKATARLHDADQAPPRVVTLRRWEGDEEQFVTVVLDADGQTLVGSAVDDGLDLRAIALAVWQALSG